MMMNYFIVLSYASLAIIKVHSSPIPNWLKLERPSIFETLSKLSSQQSANSYYSRKYQNYRLRKLSNSTGVRCNDGSVPGYYLRQSPSKCMKKWLIFLEGGWYCFNNNTCESRRRTHYDLFSSEFWSPERQFGGILSDNQQINPNFYDVNAIYIPYCSSDLWSGKKWQKTNDLYFHGSRILDAVIDDINKNPNFKKAQEITLAGSSAGGIGVLLNIDRFGRRVKKLFRRSVLVSGIIDSAWFPDYQAFRESNCTHIYDCPPEIAIQQGMKLWSPRIPKRCRKYEGPDKHWKCFMGPVIYRHLKNPVFVIQSLFDDTQLQMSKVPILEGGSNKKFSYIRQLGEHVAQTLRQAKGVFAHSCVDHEILTKSNWAFIQVNNQFLHETLSYWMTFLQSQIKRKKSKKKKKTDISDSICQRSKKSKISTVIPTSSHFHIIDSCHISQVVEYEKSSTNQTVSRCENAIPLIPLCNPSCTPLSHPVSGFKMSFVDLLELYNVRIDLIAKSLGMTMSKLQKMSTQQQIRLLYCSTL